MEYKIVKQKVLIAGTATILNQKISEHIEMGWSPLGSHHVVERYHQNKFSGTQLMETQIDLEYSQTIIKEYYEQQSGEK